MVIFTMFDVIGNAPHAARASCRTHDGTSTTAIAMCSVFVGQVDQAYSGVREITQLSPDCCKQRNNWSYVQLMKTRQLSGRRNSDDMFGWDKKMRFQTATNILKKYRHVLGAMEIAWEQSPISHAYSRRSMSHWYHVMDNKHVGLSTKKTKGNGGSLQWKYNGNSQQDHMFILTESPGNDNTWLIRNMSI